MRPARSLNLAIRLVAACTLVAAGAVGVAAADDLHGVDRILCSSVSATICTEDGECDTDLPYNWNIPQFIEIDLARKTLGTTKASGENRQSPFTGLKRENGWIFLQGVEAGRAFSFVIEEATGLTSVAVARKGLTVSVFGACTPLTTAR
jgi:hypothetical protein